MKKETEKLFASNYRRELLAATTRAESAVGTILRRLGLKYIAQYPIVTPKKTYYADIYVPSLRLVIEVDGGYHGTKEQKQLDDNRSANIRKLNIHLCRIRNSDAYSPEKVKAKIKRFAPKKRTTLGKLSIEGVRSREKG